MQGAAEPNALALVKASHLVVGNCIVRKQIDCFGPPFPAVLANIPACKPEGALQRSADAPKSMKQEMRQVITAIPVTCSVMLPSTVMASLPPLRSL